METKIDGVKKGQIWKNAKGQLFQVAYTDLNPGVFHVSRWIKSRQAYTKYCYPVNPADFLSNYSLVSES